MKTWTTYTSYLGAFAAIGATGLGVQSTKEIVNPPAQSDALDVHDTHASATLLGEFRSNLSSWLWLRADLYLHNGVEMRPLSELEIRAGKKGVGSSDNHDKGLHDDSKITTSVPSKKDDFRGIFGDIERASKAYMDMKGHSHNSPRDSLPLFRLMTLLDPQFVQGWTVGATVICWGNPDGCVPKAVDFLKVGLEHNPQSVSLHNEMGSILLRKGKELELCVPSFQKAISIGSANFERLQEQDLEALESSYRWLALLDHATGNLGRSIQVAREGTKLFAEDAVLHRLANPVPMILAPDVRKKLSAQVATETLNKAVEEAEHDEHDHDHDHEHGHDHDDDHNHDHEH
jgi:hypothetical protein